MSMDFPFDVIDADEYDRMRALHGPLTQAMRELIDAGIRTDVDEARVREAQAAIEAVTQTLRGVQREQTSTLQHAGTGRPFAWANPAVGLGNAISPRWKSSTPTTVAVEWSSVSALPVRDHPDWSTAASAPWFWITSWGRWPPTV